MYNCTYGQMDRNPEHVYVSQSHSFQTSNPSMHLGVKVEAQKKTGIQQMCDLRKCWGWASCCGLWSFVATMASPLAQ